MKRFKENIKLGDIEIWNYLDKMPMTVKVTEWDADTFVLDLKDGSSSAIRFKDRWVNDTLLQAELYYSPLGQALL